MSPSTTFAAETPTTGPPVASVTDTPDGSIAAVLASGEVVALDPLTGAQLSTLFVGREPGQPDPPQALGVMFDPNGSVLATIANGEWGCDRGVFDLSISPPVAVFEGGFPASVQMADGRLTSQMGQYAMMRSSTMIGAGV